MHIALKNIFNLYAIVKLHTISQQFKNAINISNIFSPVLLILISSISPATAEYRNDEAHKDAKKALEKFEHDLKIIGMAGIVTKTIPECYLTAGSNYRKIRVCGMLDIWAFSIDVAFNKTRSWPRTKGLTFEEVRARMEKSFEPLSTSEMKEKYGSADWLDILNETYGNFYK